MDNSSVSTVPADGLSGAQQRVLDALAWLGSIGIGSPGRYQLALVAKVKATGGYFDKVLRPLIAAGHVDRVGGNVRLTGSGGALARPLERMDSLEDYHNRLRGQLRGPSVRVLDALIAAGGEPMSREQLGEASGISVTGGYFDKVVRPLATLGLIERSAGTIKPTGLLFPEALV